MLGRDPVQRNTTKLVAKSRPFKVDSNQRSLCGFGDRASVEGYETNQIHVGVRRNASVTFALSERPTSTSANSILQSYTYSILSDPRQLQHLSSWASWRQPIHTTFSSAISRNQNVSPKPASAHLHWSSPAGGVSSSPQI